MQITYINNNEIKDKIIKINGVVRCVFHFDIYTFICTTYTFVVFCILYQDLVRLSIALVMEFSGFSKLREICY